jgi:hypothetical protein
VCDVTCNRRSRDSNHTYLTYIIYISGTVFTVCFRHPTKCFIDEMRKWKVFRLQGLTKCVQLHSFQAIWRAA